MTVSFSGWGHPDYGCSDNSDKTKPLDTAGGCGGKNYSYYNRIGTLESKDVEWEWYPCKKKKQCITIENHCNGRPHPACVYQDVNDNYIAEDEEFCPG